MAAVIKTTNQPLKVNRSIHVEQNHGDIVGVKVQAIGYLADAGIANSQGYAWSKASLPANILRPKVLTVGVDRIDTSIIASYGPNSTS